SRLATMAIVNAITQTSLFQRYVKSGAVHKPANASILSICGIWTSWPDVNANGVSSNSWVPSIPNATTTNGAGLRPTFLILGQYNNTVIDSRHIPNVEKLH